MDSLLYHVISVSALKTIYFYFCTQFIILVNCQILNTFLVAHEVGLFTECSQQLKWYNKNYVACFIGGK